MKYKVLDSYVPEPLEPIKIPEPKKDGFVVRLFKGMEYVSKCALRASERMASMVDYEVKK